MKNIELLNICQNFFNRFITSDELVCELLKINNKKITKYDVEETNKLIKNIKNIINNTSNEVDELVTKEKEKIKYFISKLEGIQTNNDFDEFIDSRIKKLNEDYNKEFDSYERWSKLVKYINKNKYFNKCFNSLTSYELLEFIAQNISAPFPPQLNQSEFEKLVKAGIEKDEREWLWRLAVNYVNRDISFNSIANYFIKIKDGYYIAELISAIGEKLDIDYVIDNINDKKLIND